MLRRQMLAGVSLFATGAVLMEAPQNTWAQDYCVKRGLFSGGGGPLRNGYRGPYATGSGNRPWSGPPNRFYDSTGRWTGDGVDTMSTASPTPQARGTFTIHGNTR